MWLCGRQMEGWLSDDARRVASQITLCYEPVTVLSWFEARPICFAENGSSETIDFDRYRNRTKKFLCDFPFQINIVRF